MSQYVIKSVVAVSFGNCQTVIARLRPYDPVWLVRQPDNSNDPNAIQVLDKSGDRIGYLDRFTAVELAPALDQHEGYWPADVWSLRHCGMEDSLTGVQIGFEELPQVSAASA